MPLRLMQSVLLIALLLLSGCQSVASRPAQSKPSPEEKELATIERAASKVIKRGRVELEDGLELANTLRDVTVVELEGRKTVTVSYSHYPASSIRDTAANVIRSVWESGVQVHQIEVVAYTWDSEDVLCRASMTANQAYARQKSNLSKSLAWSPMYMRDGTDWTVEGPNWSREIFDRIVWYNIEVSKAKAEANKKKECPTCD